MAAMQDLDKLKAKHEEAARKLLGGDSKEYQAVMEAISKARDGGAMVDVSVQTGIQYGWIGCRATVSARHAVW